MPQKTERTMEWVETTARTVEEAQELALDQLGVIADEAEFEVLTAPKPGLFGRLRGEARVRARVRPTPARPKQDRRRPGRRTADGKVDSTERSKEPAPTPAPPPARPGGVTMTNDAPAPPAEEPDVDAVREAAVGFVTGLTSAFGFDTSVDATVDGNEIEVRVDGASLGLLIGPGGRTLLAVQDLTRVAAQRRLGDHDTRLRVDVAGYREKRREALERFAATVAEQVKASGVARSLDPMPSADRKVLHDALAAIDGVTSRSEGDDPNRRVVVAPA
jgi:spoIIIJ-associated protein